MNKLFIKMLIGKLKKLNPFRNIVIIRVPSLHVHDKALDDILALNLELTKIIKTEEYSYLEARKSAIASAALIIAIESYFRNPQDVMDELVRIIKKHNELLE